MDKVKVGDVVKWVDWANRPAGGDAPRGVSKVTEVVRDTLIYVEDTSLTAGERCLAHEESFRDTWELVSTAEQEAAAEEPSARAAAPSHEQVCSTAPTAQVNPKAAYGATKPSVGLIPPIALLHEAMAFEDGARKYGAYNWRTNPVEAMTYVHAIYRHLGLWLDGDELTSDTNVHNLGAIRACCGILLDSIEAGILIDNRPPKAPSDAVQNRLKAQKLEEAKARAGK